jgi:hypothetical protein
MCRQPDLGAVGTDSTCAGRRDPTLDKGVDQGLPRLTVLCRQLPVAFGRAHLCADGPPSAQAPLPRAHQALGKEVIFLFLG